MTSDAIPMKERYEITLKKVVVALAFIAAGFLLGRVRLFSMLSPFGPAFVAACFLERRQETLLAAAGVVLGSVLLPDLTLYIVTVVLALCAALLIGYRRMKRWVVLAASVLAYIIAAAIFRTQDVYTVMMAVPGVPCHDGDDLCFPYAAADHDNA